MLATVRSCHEQRIWVGRVYYIAVRRLENADFSRKFKHGNDNTKPPEGAARKNKPRNANPPLPLKVQRETAHREVFARNAASNVLRGIRGLRS